MSLAHVMQPHPPSCPTNKKQCKLREIPLYAQLAFTTPGASVLLQRLDDEITVSRRLPLPVAYAAALPLISNYSMFLGTVECALGKERELQKFASTLSGEDRAVISHSGGVGLLFVGFGAGDTASLRCGMFLCVSDLYPGFQPFPESEWKRLKMPCVSSTPFFGLSFHTVLTGPTTGAESICRQAVHCFQPNPASGNAYVPASSQRG